MTIGPEPMMSIFLMSVRVGIGWRARLSRGLLHHGDESVEKVAGVVRARRCFWMILHAEKRERAVAHAFVGVVVQIDVRDFDIARRERVGIDAEAVVLGGDFDLLRAQIFHRMVRTVMAEFQLERVAAQREAAQLMAEADAENRDSAGELANILDGVGDGLGIAGTVRKKNTVRLQREDVFGGGSCRDDGHIAAMVDEKPEDVLLDAVVVGDDLVTMALRRRSRFLGMRGTISFRGG